MFAFLQIFAYVQRFFRHFGDFFSSPQRIYPLFDDIFALRRILLPFSAIRSWFIMPQSQRLKLDSIFNGDSHKLVLNMLNIAKFSENNFFKWLICLCQYFQKQKYLKYLNWKVFELSPILHSLSFIFSIAVDNNCRIVIRPKGTLVVWELNPLFHSFLPTIYIL